jgi:hypothetical protein
MNYLWNVEEVAFYAVRSLGRFGGLGRKEGF